jgi:hypothetical protein
MTLLRALKYIRVNSLPGIRHTILISTAVECSRKLRRRSFSEFSAKYGYENTILQSNIAGYHSAVCNMTLKQLLKLEARSSSCSVTLNDTLFP